ncbi:GTP-binding protein [Kocuria sp.]|uniref:GTP-binding protein n=1 Tax=Kocuria sp. TaxID=1871328 RepID=UPI0026DB446D|nr:GTP-binding protein [Kocuria sp.]MDO4919628.1 GTP-binding protein [Kocuria sp.]
MDSVDVVAVVGACPPERSHFAREVARRTRRMLIPAQRLALAADPVAEALGLVPWCTRPAGALVEFPEHTDVTELIGATAGAGSGAVLTGVVCVVDAAHLLQDLQREDCVLRPAGPPAWWRHTARALLNVLGVEFASVVVLVNWEVVDTPQLSTTMSLLSHLAPRARVQLHRGGADTWVAAALAGGTPYDVAQERAGWVTLLNGEHDPHMTDPRVCAVRHENVRPLHPGRLARLLDHRIETGEFGTVLRSAGFCRLATRPHVTARWDHVGRMISFSPLARDEDTGQGDELLALGQDLGIIGLDLDAPALSAALDDAALTDDEFAAGPAAWSRFPDPFPAWPTVADRTD